VSDVYVTRATPARGVEDGEGGRRAVSHTHPHQLRRIGGVDKGDGDYKAITFRDGEAMEYFVLRLQLLVSQLVVLGEIIDEQGGPTQVNADRALDRDYSICPPSRLRM